MNTLLSFGVWMEKTDILPELKKDLIPYNQVLMFLLEKYIVTEFLRR